MVGYFSPAQAVSDAELETLEKQIEQQEAEEKIQAEAAATRKAEAEVRRKSEAEKQAEEKRVKEIVEKRLSELEKQRQEEEKRELEKTSQAELERKRQEEEAKRFALEEQKRIDEEAAKAKVTVVFFRSSAFTGSLQTGYIHHESTKIGEIPNGSFFIYSSPLGTQAFSVIGSIGATANNSFQFESGQVYYIQFEIGMLSSTLLPVTEAGGREAIRGLKNTGKINPADVFSDYDESEAYKEPTTTQQQAPL